MRKSLIILFNAVIIFMVGCHEGVDIKIDLDQTVLQGFEESRDVQIELRPDDKDRIFVSQKGRFYNLSIGEPRKNGLSVDRIVLHYVPPFKMMVTQEPYYGERSSRSGQKD